MAEKKVIKKSNWTSNFTLIGRPKISEDYTFKIDERSSKSNWVYNSMNLGVDCGEKFGIVYAECMGGYSEDNENKIFVHGKTESGQDDWDKQIVVDWDDRFNEDVLDEIGDLCFINVGLEKTSAGKTFVKKFLSAYDAIAYIKEHLSEDMTVNVRGSLRYSSYNGNVQVRKNINSIFLSNVDSPANYKATFTQSILLDKDSASLKDIDKAKGVMLIHGRVLDYVKEVNGIEVKGQYPYVKQFEFKFPDLENEKQCKALYEKLLKVKKGVTQVNFEGEFIENGAVVTATWDDIPDDIKDLVELGLYTKEEALAKCTVNGNRERRMVLVKPQIKNVGDEDNKVSVIQKFEECYTEEDLILDYLYKDDSSDYPNDDIPFDTEDDSDNDLDWLSKL